MARLTFEEFDARVQKAYNGKISIIKDTYIDTRHKVTAYCNVHKITFERRARDLANGYAKCPECFKELNKMPTNSWETILNRFRTKWGEKYSYEETTYNGYKTEMKVHCNDCNTDFEITPEHHLKYNNGGCPICHKYKIIKCSNCGRNIKVDKHCSNDYQTICDECKDNQRKIQKEKNQNSKQIHKSIKNTWSIVHEYFLEKYGMRFSYDESTYKGMNRLMSIHCNECDVDFEISPKSHLKTNNGGCPICKHYVTKQCLYCGKDVLVKKHTRNVYCEECEPRFIQNKKIKRRSKIKIEKIKCPFCGQYHLSNELCNNELCNLFHSVNDLKKLIPFGFDYSSVGSLRYLEEFNKSVGVLLNEYYDNKLSAQQIFIKYNCKEFFRCEGTLRYFIKEKLKKKTRNMSEAQHNYLEHKEPNIKPFNFKNIEYMTWENKKYTLRSSYEFDYAKQLDEQKIHYLYENLRIYYFDTQEQKRRLSIPDFYLPDTNTIVEIKSIYTLDVVNMIDKRNAYINAGYNFKLIFEHQEYDLDNLLPFSNNKKFKELKMLFGHNKGIGRSNWRWMHNNIERIRVKNEDVNSYLEKGWILGNLTQKRQQENIKNGVVPSTERTNDESN